MLLLVILSFLSTILSPVLFDEDYSTIFYLIFVIIYFQLLTRITLVLLRMDEKSVYFAITNSLKIAIQLSTIIYLITVNQMGFISIFYGELAGTIFLFFATLPYLLKNMQPGFEKNELNAMIKFGAPAIFGNFSAQIFSFVDRGLLARIVSEAAVGRYVLGFKISNIIGTLLITSFNIALPAIAWQQVGTENQNRFFSKMLTYFSFVLIWSGLFLAAYSRGIIHQFALDQSYWDATIIVPILLVGMIFNGMHVVINYGLLVSKNTQRIPVIILISVIIDIILNIIFIGFWGFIGTAFAMMITAISRTVLTYLFSKNYFVINWEFRKILLMLTIAILLYCTTTIFNNYDLIYRILFKAIILLTFPFILYFFKFYEQIEIETIKRISKKYLNRIKHNG
jgi:O-antigen/teichoic acid export membrane protein